MKDVFVADFFVFCFLPLFLTSAGMDQWNHSDHWSTLSHVRVCICVCVRVLFSFLFPVGAWQRQCFYKLNDKISQIPMSSKRRKTKIINNWNTGRIQIGFLFVDG